jgi:hypothetical protein
MLYEAVKLNRALIEKCVVGLSSLDNETRRWLRSAKHSEIDQRPLARLQNAESQQTYATYIARLLCYSLRVLQSCEDSEELESVIASDNSRSLESDRDDRSDYGENYEDDSDSSTGPDTPPVIDVFRDARRLYL